MLDLAAVARLDAAISNDLLYCTVSRARLSVKTNLS